MKTVIRNVIAAATLVAATLGFVGCAQMGTEPGLTGLGKVRRDTCRKPVYVKGDMGRVYSK